MFRFLIMPIVRFLYPGLFALMFLLTVPFVSNAQDWPTGSDGGFIAGGGGPIFFDGNGGCSTGTCPTGTCSSRSMPGKIVPLTTPKRPRIDPPTGREKPPKVVEAENNKSSPLDEVKLPLPPDIDYQVEVEQMGERLRRKIEEVGANVDSKLQGLSMPDLDKITGDMGDLREQLVRDLDSLKGVIPNGDHLVESLTGRVKARFDRIDLALASAGERLTRIEDRLNAPPPERPKTVLERTAFYLPFLAFLLVFGGSIFLFVVGCVKWVHRRRKKLEEKILSRLNIRPPTGSESTGQSL